MHNKLEVEKAKILEFVGKDAYERGFEWAKNIKKKEIKLDLRRKKIKNKSDLIC